MPSNADPYSPLLTSYKGAMRALKKELISPTLLQVCGGNGHVCMALCKREPKRNWQLRIMLQCLYTVHPSVSLSAWDGGGTPFSWHVFTVPSNKIVLLSELQSLEKFLFTTGNAGRGIWRNGVQNATFSGSARL